MLEVTKMNKTKAQVIKLVKNLPDKNITIEDIMDELHFKMQVDKGLADLKAGEKSSHEQFKKRMGKWNSRCSDLIKNVCHAK
jgi:hypothetical protein